MNAGLSSILSRYPASATPLAEPIPLGNAGGLSGSRLWRFESQRGQLIARQWPDDYAGRSQLEKVHLWLARADALPFVPKPVKAKDGTTVQELNQTLWDISPWMQGEPAFSPDVDRVSHACSALARFHLAMAETIPNEISPGLASRLTELENLQAHEFDDLRKLLAQNSTDRVVSRGLKWLELASRITPQLLPKLRAAALEMTTLQPVIRDVRPDHFLFSSDRLTGLVDFGGMGIDTVALDLARLLGEWLGQNDIARSAAINAYAGIRGLTPVELAHIPTFESANAVLSGARWIRWHFKERRQFEDPSAVANGIAKSIKHINSLTFH